MYAYVYDQASPWIRSTALWLVHSLVSSRLDDTFFLFHFVVYVFNFFFFLSSFSSKNLIYFIFFWPFAVNFFCSFLRPILSMMTFTFERTRRDQSANTWKAVLSFLLQDSYTHSFFTYGGILYKVGRCRSIIFLVKDFIWVSHMADNSSFLILGVFIYIPCATSFELEVGMLSRKKGSRARQVIKVYVTLCPQRWNDHIAQVEPSYSRTFCCFNLLNWLHFPFRCVSEFSQ